MGNSPKGEFMSKKANIMKILGIGALSLFLLGCSKTGFLLTEEESLEMKDLVEEQMISENATIITENTTIEEENREVVVESADELVVHICGAVRNSGVYFLQGGQRIYHAIEAAGGLVEEADGDYVNQALLLEDGMKIVIPTKEEVKQWQEEEAEDENKMVLDMQNLEEDYVQYSKPKLSDEKALNNSQKVDLNTADEALLCTLPGIGTSRAKSIIDYRTQNGLFQKIEDVMKVSGIKEAAFDKIKDKITVSN